MSSPGSGSNVRKFIVHGLDLDDQHLRREPKMRGQSRSLFERAHLQPGQDRMPPELRQGRRLRDRVLRRRLLRGDQERGRRLQQFR